MLHAHTHFFNAMEDIGWIQDSDDWREDTEIIFVRKDSTLFPNLKDYIQTKTKERGYVLNGVLPKRNVRAFSMIMDE